MEQSKVDEEHSLIKPKTLEEVRTMIRAHKRNDFIFFINWFIDHHVRTPHLAYSFCGPCDGWLP